MHQEEEKKIDLLKNLLLDEDRIEIDALKLKIKALEAIIEKKERLSQKIDPIIEDRLVEFTDKIPKTFAPLITESLKNEIENSKDQVVDVLYPIIGRMIKKYIKNEFEILSEKINNQIQKRFSIKKWIRKLKSKTTGVTENNLILNELTSYQIHEIFIIEKDSGLLKANYSKTKTIDKDILSGMLTAIKSFVEDAFKTGKGHLQSIEHDLYKIHLQNFKSFYIAVIIEGVFNIAFKNELEDKLYSFSKKHLSKKQPKEYITKALEAFFQNERE